MQHNERSKFTQFRAESIFSYEDKQAVKSIGRALVKLKLLEALRIGYWWWTNEAYRFSPMNYYEAHQDRLFDARYHVDTQTRAELPQLSIDGSNMEHGVYYQASPVTQVRKLIKGLKIDYEQYVFIDIGSGKGRVLLVASEFPFNQVLGIEFARELHEIAEKNISIYPNKRCQSTRSLNMDATHYNFPDQNMVLYLYNPFDTYILSQILERINAASKNYKRTIYIIYHHLPDQELFKEKLAEFKLLKKGRKFYFYGNLNR